MSGTSIIAKFSMSLTLCSVTCLTTDAYMTADPGVASPIPP